MYTRKQQQGFTLVEMLIAAVIIAVGILAWAKTHDSAIKARAKSNDISTASELAMAKLETLALESKSSKIEKSEEPESSTLHNITYETEWDVESATSGNSTANLRRAQVTVKWNHYGQKSLSYQRIITGN